MNLFLGVEHCFSQGIFQSTNLMQTPNTKKYYHRRHTLGAKIQCGKGNSPDRKLRSQNYN